jgi:amino acid transporter
MSKTDPQIKRSISPPGLLLASVSAIIGSGWLFSAFYTSTIAGPAALISWLIGGVGIIIVAFVFAEICTLIPVTGSSTRIPQFTHGTFISFLFSWMIWLSYAALAPTEVQAVTQYSSYFWPQLTSSSGELTHIGFVFALVLMLFVSIINTYSLKWLIKSNSFITFLKVLIPLVLIAFIFMHNHSLKTALSKGFAPMHMHGILGALSTGGIVFAFHGFKQAAEMAGEAKRPHIALPVAIIGSVILCLILFLLLQLAFMASLTPSNISHGWSHLELYNNNSPLFSILKQNHLTDYIPMLSIAAIIAPLASGLMYCSSAARSLYGMSQNGYLPELFQKLTAQGNPIYAILLNFFIGLLLFFPLPGWDQMVTFLTSIITITYAAGPVCLLALRKQLPKGEHKRPFTLPFATLWCYMAFTLCTLFSYWSGWHILSKLGTCIAIGLAVLFSYKLISKNGRNIKLNISQSLWFFVYIIGLMLLSYLGNYGGGHEILNETYVMVIMLVFCAFIMLLAQINRLPSEETKRYIKGLA